MNNSPSIRGPKQRRAIEALLEYPEIRIKDSFTIKLLRRKKMYKVGLYLLRSNVPSRP